MAKREKKPVHKVVMTEGKRQIIQQLLQEYVGGKVNLPPHGKEFFHAGGADIILDLLPNNVR